MVCLALEKLRTIVDHAVQERLAHGDEARDFILLDAIIAHNKDPDTRFADAITYTVGGFHTTGNGNLVFVKRVLGHHKPVLIS